MSLYAQVGGVDYTKIQPFKDRMKRVSVATIAFPNKRYVRIVPDSDGGFQYTGSEPHMFKQVTEGLGNKNWIAEWMYEFAGKRNSYYYNIAICNALMAANDVAAKGALPVTYTDEAAAGDSEWFDDPVRSSDLAAGYFQVCEEVGMALVGGESPSLKYLVHAVPPVKSAPVLSGCAVGIITWPSRNLITGKRLVPGSAIIAARSSGLHANGIGLLIGTTLLKFGENGFLTKLPNGKTVGEEALTPTRSYVRLVEALQQSEIEIRGFLPGTGDGVAKLAFDKRPLTYRIHSWWRNYHLIFEYLLEAGVPLAECLKTFNMGSGWYVFVDRKDITKTLDLGTKAGYDMLYVGDTEEGARQTIFGPANNLVLLPPGE